jgi:hypothetical protein
LGPLIVAELLRRAIPVVAVIVGSSDSAKEVNNSLDTLSSLQQMSNGGHTGGRAIPMVYLENARAVKGNKEDKMASRSAVDKQVEENIRQLALLFSGMHRELDRTDLVNWLDHSKVSPSIPAQLLEVIIHKEDDSNMLEAYSGLVVGVASLLASEDDLISDLNAPYATKGYLQEEVLEYADIPNHTYITTAARVPKIFERFTQAKQLHRDTVESLSGMEVVGVNSGFGTSGMSGGDGMVI